MKCSFCDNPAAHPATGCQYSETMIACFYCVQETWAWVRNHTRGKSARAAKQARDKGHVVPAMSFYESAGHMRGPHAR